MMLAEIGWSQIFLALVITFVSFLLICLVLLQKNRGSGLSGAFGGAGGQSAFGTKTGDVLTWVTVGLTAVFLLLCVIGNWVFVPVAEANPENQPTQQPTTTPPASTAPAARVPSATPAGPARTTPITVTPVEPAPVTPSKTSPSAPPASGPSGS